MRRIFTSLFFLANVSLFAQDATTATQPAWSGNYAADLKSRYLGNTVSAVFADQLVVQQEVDVSRHFGKTVVTGMVWNSTGFQNVCSDFACETDVGFNISRQVGKYVVSVSAWDFFLTPTAGFDVVQVDAKISRTFTRDKNTFSPFVEHQHYNLTRRC